MCVGGGPRRRDETPTVIRSRRVRAHTPRARTPGELAERSRASVATNPAELRGEGAGAAGRGAETPTLTHGAERNTVEQRGSADQPWVARFDSSGRGHFYARNPEAQIGFCFLRRKTD